MEMEEAVEIWKREGIDYAECDFNCGGDSMNHTEFRFYKGNKEIKETWGLKAYFDDAIYNHVDFYEISDGDYLGESGTVTITLSEDEDEFDYEKLSTEEWLETYSDVLKVEITKEQACFLEEYVSDMSGSEWEGEVINYKKDFILKEEHEDMIQELHELFYEEVRDWASNQGELSDESETYETSISIIKEDDKFFIELEVSCQVYHYS